REVEHRRLDTDCPNAHGTGLNAQLHRRRQLELAARGERHLAAHLENPAIEAPAINAEKDIAAERAERLGVGLLDDAPHVVVFEIEDREAGDARWLDLPVRQQSG